MKFFDFQFLIYLVLVIWFLEFFEQRLSQDENVASVAGVNY